MTSVLMTSVVVSGWFDNIRSHDLRFLEEAAALGELTVLLWSDSAIQQVAGKPPRFALEERRYFLNAVRYISRVIDVGTSATPDSLPEIAGLSAQIWADTQAAANAAREQFCRAHKIQYRVFTPEDLAGFPEPPPMPSEPGRKKVIATGCYDWFHSGHVRFTEEASAFGSVPMFGQR